MKWVTICVCALAFAASAYAQMSPTESRTPSKASLQGTVVKEPSGEPLKKAIIELIAENQEEGGNYTATSDQDGHFSIPEIQSGRYRMFVERTGFLEVDEKRRRSEGLLISLAAGQELKDQTLHMLAAAVVTGRVIDEDGDAMANVEISVLRRKASTFEPAGSAHTDDLGEYRVGGLLPGKYYIVATPMPSFPSVVASQKKEADPAKPAPPSYAPTYYPSAADRAQASPVELHAGEEMPADFSLTRRHMAHIRGKVMGLRGDAKGMVVLRSKDAGPAFAASDLDKNGKFEFPNVAPGNYTLIAMTVMSETPLSLREPIEVGSADIDDVQFTLMPPATVRGQVHFDSKFPKSEAAKAVVFLRAQDGDEDLFNGVAMSYDEAPSSHGFARVKPDGSFELSNVPAGTYDFSVSGDAKAFNETYVDSATVGTKNVVDTGLKVNGGIVVADVSVSSETGRIEGTVTAEKGDPVADAVVVAVPNSRFRKQASRYRKVSADQAGKFTIRGLRPGTYTLLAWEHLEGDEYQDADFLKPYEDRGVEVKVEKASQQTVALKVIAAPAEQP
jgi:protocatechuate 3,4-dioxygenase beta subunit